MNFFKNSRREQSYIPTRQPEPQIKYVYVTTFESAPNQYEKMFLITYGNEVYVEPHTQLTFGHIRGGSYWDDAVKITYNGEQIEYEGSDRTLEDTIVIGKDRITVAHALKEYLSKDRETMKSKIYFSMEKKARVKSEGRMNLAQSRQSTPKVTQSDRDEIMRTLHSFQTTSESSSRDETIRKILGIDYKRR